MGISGLLPFLKDYRCHVTLAKYAGQTAAIDVSCWIHQGAYYADFSEGLESAIKKIITYISKKIKMLQEHKIEPIVVFDGASIPVKKRIQEGRAKIRITSKEKISCLMKEGRVDEANKKFGESFTITPYIIQRILKVVRGQGCKWIIAPYEADAQLAYLYKTGKVDVVFTEDSDLIPYGVTKLLYKLDNDGEGYELDMNNLIEGVNEYSDKVRSSQELTENGEWKIMEVIDLDNDSQGNQDEENSPNESSTRSCDEPNDNQTDKLLFSKDKFLSTCILAGCDYLESIKGIGFKTAYKLMKEHGNIKTVLRAISSAKKYSIPKSYIQNFHTAYMTFLYQIVYDYEKEEWINLTNPNEENFYGKMFLEQSDPTFCGEPIAQEHAKLICEGEMDIKTREPINIESLCDEFKLFNDPLTGLVSSESEECTIISVKDMKDVTEVENKPMLEKKPSSTQKKIWFSTKKKLLPRKRIPSPFKTKIAENLKHLPFVKQWTKKDNIASIRKRNYKQMQLIDKQNNDSENSDMEDDTGEDSLINMFKRAKKQEDDPANVKFSNPLLKLQTIKKKTFMRWMSSSNL